MLERPWSDVLQEVDMLDGYDITTHMGRALR